ncbi:MAG: hypothetical protein K6E33_05340 [Lachnospiraceae bacterium]|nr:hypothetical protein [Lachnospiraceae bacterium]
MDPARKKKILQNGIGTVNYARDHERFIEESLRKGADPEKLLEIHELKLSWMQHERLVHFLVTMLTAIGVLLSVIMYILLDSTVKIAALALMILLLILLICYMVHYYHLENTVQLWYAYDDEIRSLTESDKSTESDR